MLPRAEATWAVPVLSWPCSPMSSEDKIYDVSFMSCSDGNGLSHGRGCPKREVSEG